MVVVTLICKHIKVACTCKSEYNILFFTGFFALECFINCHFNCMTAFRCRKNSFNPCKLFCCLKYFCLFYASCFN